MSSTGEKPVDAEQNEEEALRNELRTAMQSLKRREPLDPTYKRLLMNGIVSSKRPNLPKDKFYKRIGSNLRSRVEKFVQETEGKDPFDRISQRQQLQEEQMRAALTLREAKKHEQKQLLELTLSTLPKRNGMDAPTRRRYLEGIVLGLQSGDQQPKRAKSPVSTAASQVEQARIKAERDRQIEMAKAREDARKRREEEERKRAREEEAKRKTRIETPQQALHKIYHPIFKKLWDMEFAELSGTNPFRTRITPENCASLGAPDYFDIVKEPMNLMIVQEKVERMDYPTLQSFFSDIELMINNALKYNSDAGNPYHKAAVEMRKLFRKIGKKVVQTLQQRQAKK